MKITFKKNELPGNIKQYFEVFNVITAPYIRAYSVSTYYYYYYVLSYVNDVNDLTYKHFHIIYHYY